MPKSVSSFTMPEKQGESPLFPKNEGAKPLAPGRYKYVDSGGEHLHTLDGKPLIGVSTACKILDKSGLTWWASGKACETLGWLNIKKNSLEDCILNAGKRLEEIRPMSNRQYYNLLEKAYRAHDNYKKEKADTGKDMHLLLEEFIRARMKGRDPLVIDPLILPFVKWADKNVRRFLFSELHCYSEILWCGGIADFGYVDKDGLNALGDFKSSDRAYWNQWVQTGGYATLIEEHGGFNKIGDRVFPLMSFDYHAIFAERAGLDKPFFNREVGRTRRAFAYCANLWREKVWFEETFK